MKVWLNVRTDLYRFLANVGIGHLIPSLFSPINVVIEIECSPRRTMWPPIANNKKPLRDLVRKFWTLHWSWCNTESHMQITHRLTFVTDLEDQFPGGGNSGASSEWIAVIWRRQEINVSGGNLAQQYHHGNGATPWPIRLADPAPNSWPSFKGHNMNNCSDLQNQANRDGFCCK